MSNLEAVDANLEVFTRQGSAVHREKGHGIPAHHRRGVVWQFLKHKQRRLGRDPSLANRATHRLQQLWPRLTRGSLRDAMCDAVGDHGLRFRKNELEKGGARCRAPLQKE